MKNLLIIFTIVFSVGYWFTSVTAKQAPQVDEFELLMQRIESHIKEASEVTQMARMTSQKMVEAKVEEKKELKEAVVVAENCGYMGSTMIFSIPFLTISSKTV